MTSMPASRSARAMIFAPRSCPSRPGLATTTRIFRSPAGMAGAIVANRGPLEDRRLPVGPEDLLQRRDDLALAAVGPRRLEQRRHEVGPLLRGGRAQRAQRRLDAGRVPRPLH